MPCLLSGTGARFGSTFRLRLHLTLLLKHEKKTQGDHPAPGPPQGPPLPPQHWSSAWTHKEQSQSSLFLSFWKTQELMLSLSLYGLSWI